MSDNMNFYQLKSILSSSKQSFALKETSPSFFIAEEKARPYIEPTFEKIIYSNKQRPTIILISAVAATGKSALAYQLSLDTRLPVLDLGKHKPRTRALLAPLMSCLPFALSCLHEP